MADFEMVDLDKYIDWSGGGLVNTTQPLTTSPPDASGGAGSFLAGLQSILLGGLSVATAQAINKAYPGSMTDGTISVNATGQLRPAAAASNTPVNNVTAQVKNALANPLILGALFVGVALLIYKRLR